MWSAAFGSRVRSRGTSLAWPVEYSRWTRSTSSIVFDIVSNFSTSDSLRRRAIGRSFEKGRFYRAMRILLLAVAFLLTPFVLAQDAPKAKRLALVIGNGAYKDVPLPNPKHDADDVEKVLKDSGFVVIKRQDVTLKEMHIALREFGDRLDRQGVGLF